MRKYLNAYAPTLGELWLIMLALLCVGGTIISTLFVLFLQDLFNLDQDMVQTLSLTLYPLLFVLVVPYIYLRARNSYLVGLHNGQPIPENAAPIFGKLPAVVVFFLLLILVPVFSVATEPLYMWIKMPEIFKKLFESLGGQGWVSVLSVVIFAPLLEEWLCRGVALKSLLKNGYSPAAAIAWSALMFGVIHMNPWQAIPAFLMGLLFGWVYWRTRSIWTAIFMHAVNNGLSVLITSFFPDLPSDTSTFDLLGASWHTPVLIASIAVSALIIWLFSKTFAPAAPLFEKPIKRSIP